MLADHPLNGLTSKILKCAVEVHRHLGPGLFESAYFACLRHELGAAGLAVRCNVTVGLHYKGVELDCTYKLDFLVEDSVVIELKAIPEVAWIHKAQLLTYLRLTGRPVGLLINFNVPVLKDGVSRLLNGRPTQVKT